MAIQAQGDKINLDADDQHPGGYFDSGSEHPRRKARPGRPAGRADREIKEKGPQQMKDRAGLGKSEFVMPMPDMIEGESRQQHGGQDFHRQEIDGPVPPPEPTDEDGGCGEKHQGGQVIKIAFG